MNSYEKRKLAIEQAMRKHVDEFQAIYKKAEDESRAPSDEERLEIESHIKAIETLKEEKAGVEANIKTLSDVEDISRQLGPATAPLEGAASPDVRVAPGGDRVDRIVKSLGESFTESKQFKDVHAKIKDGVRESFSTGAVQLQAKGTLLEGTAGSGAGLVPVPQVIPGQVQRLFQPLRIADLLLSGQANVNSLRYIVEGTATSGAAGVAEGGSKPESTIGLSTVDEPVKKIATVLVVSDEMLEDIDQVQSYINGRLSLFVQIEEERQLMAGAGTNELVGLANRSGAQAVNSYARGTVDNNAVALFKAMNGQRGSALLEPDFIVMNPANWQTTRLLTDNQGQFFGGGPFMGPYNGQSAMAGVSAQLQGAQDSIWGKPLVVTTAIGAGTALIGTQSAAQVFRRGGVSVEATNSDQDYFRRNLVAIRAEERLALALYRPTAFTFVTGLS